MHASARKAYPFLSGLPVHLKDTWILPEDPTGGEVGENQLRWNQ